MHQEICISFVNARNCQKNPYLSGSVTYPGQQKECKRRYQAISELGSQLPEYLKSKSPLENVREVSLSCSKNPENTNDLHCEENEDSGDLKECCFMDLSLLNSVIENSSVCNLCEVGSLKLVKAKKNGLANKLLLKCCSCGEINAFDESKIFEKVTSKITRIVSQKK